MFRRAFWFSAGAAAGVWATTKVNRKLRALTPESLAARAADRAVETGHRLREFALDVRAGMAQREEELHDALGLTGHPEEQETAVARRLPGRTLRAELGSPATGDPARSAPHIQRTGNPENRKPGTPGKEDR